ncbi:hypothetical protein [Streptomyces sp. NPDC089795]|uniref:hypothetical protein n=1 Tax=Streptomyces sp. NPDC089795 TaxID=3155297 RepID=UPI0034276F7F
MFARSVVLTAEGPPQGDAVARTQPAKPPHGQREASANGKTKSPASAPNGPIMLAYGKPKDITRTEARSDPMAIAGPRSRAR